jgi:hypothetical protein
MVMTSSGPLTPSGVKCNDVVIDTWELLTEFVRRRPGCYNMELLTEFVCRRLGCY